MDRDECGIKVIKGNGKGDAHKMGSNEIKEIVRNGISDIGDRTRSYAMVHMKRCECARNNNGKRLIEGQ